MIRERLAQERNQKYVGVNELAAAARRILHESGPMQSRGTVTAVPDERTIRFYLSEGLLAPAQERQGTASVFGYLQLLQLLVVKKLQADHLPIRQIREALSGQGITQLERWLGVEGQTAARNEAAKYLENLLQKPIAPPPPLRKKPAPPTSLPTVANAWTRFEVTPGLELHLRDGYQPPTDAPTRQRLVAQILDIIEAFARQ